MTAQTTNAPRLADQLAAAEASARPLRERAGNLQAALTAAVNTRNYALADTLQAEMGEAREALILADATAAAFRDGAARLGQERAQQTRQLADARQRDQAAADLADARAAEAHATAEMDAALESMNAALRAAREHLRTAGRHQGAVTQAHHAARAAQGRLTPWPPGSTGPAIPKANKVSSLAERDPLIAALKLALR